MYLTAIEKITQSLDKRLGDWERGKKVDVLSWLCCHGIIVNGAGITENQETSPEVSLVNQHQAQNAQAP